MNFLTKRYVNSKRNITAIVVIPQNRRNNNNRIYTNVGSNMPQDIIVQPLNKEKIK